MNKYKTLISMSGNVYIIEHSTVSRRSINVNNYKVLFAYFIANEQALARAGYNFTDEFHYEVRDMTQEEKNMLTIKLLSGHLR